MTTDNRNRLNQLIWAMIDYYDGDAGRIQHFTKVYTLAKWIAESEDLDETTCDRIAALALTHDIGIKVAVDQHGYCNAQMQEQLGPAAAKKLLDSLGFDRALVDRVCTVIGRHHTYTDIDGIDCQILIEADTLVNLQEGTQKTPALAHAYEYIFRTKAGKNLLKKMYPMS